MPIVSYAQNREDVLLNRVFPGPTGFYIDVGAALPVDLSVTKLFYDRGWRGINVEPQERFYQELVADRPRDVNLPVVLSAEPGTLTLYEAPGHEGLTTANADAARQLEESGRTVVRRDIPALTLAEVCAKHAPADIDFLKIDVEGEERNVLLGADFTRWRPRVMVIEATEQDSPVPNHHLWEDVVLAADYTFAAFDGLNRYYVRAGDEDLIPRLQVPANVFDDFVPYEYDRWRRSAEVNEKNLLAVHAECDRIRAAFDKLLADHKGLWDRATDMGRGLESAGRRAEALERELAETRDRAEAAERELAAARGRLGGVRQVLGRLRDGLRGPADAPSAAVVVSHRGSDERARVLTPVGGR
jgi:FkbM family methyltransferase